jgi:3-deoxy-7-phosphoheptulonate synthase
MIIEFETNVEPKERKRITNRLAHSLRNLREVVFGERLFLVISGQRDDLNLQELSADPAIRFISPQDTTAFFCRRDFHPNGTTQVRFGDVTLGNGQLVLIAGPCAVEREDDLLATAEAVKQAGAHALRAGAFKPRTSPYNFQGLGVQGLKLLAEAGRAVGLPVVSEVLNPYDIEAACQYIDLIQVGTRNMTNQALLKHLGKKNKPILLKRGSSSSLEELIRAAEFVAIEGNPNIAMCERGIKTFESATRNTLDLSAVPVLRHMTHLPIVVDPSHAAGRGDIVPDMALAAAVVGADALLIEVHVAPERMIKPGDGDQSLLPGQFAELVQKLKVLLDAVGRKLAPQPYIP